VARLLLRSSLVIKYRYFVDSGNTASLLFL
jgi:hypothetical protein